MASAKRNEKQNVTISLDRKTIQKAKILAARRSTSISGLLAHQIEILVGEEEAYERAERQAMTLLDQGFHLGGVIRVGRDSMSGKTFIDTNILIDAHDTDAGAKHHHALHHQEPGNHRKLDYGLGDPWAKERHRHEVNALPKMPAQVKRLDVHVAPTPLRLLRESRKRGSQRT